MYLLFQPSYLACDPAAALGVGGGVGLGRIRLLCGAVVAEVYTPQSARALHPHGAPTGYITPPPWEQVLWSYGGSQRVLHHNRVLFVHIALTTNQCSLACVGMVLVCACDHM